MDGSADTVSEVPVLERKNAERLPALGLAREELPSRYNIKNFPSQSDTDVLCCFYHLNSSIKVAIF